MKILGSGENFKFGAKILGSGEILGWGENFGLAQNFWVRAKILCSGENFENFGLGRKF